MSQGLKPRARWGSNAQDVCLLASALPHIVLWYRKASNRPETYRMSRIFINVDSRNKLVHPTREYLRKTGGEWIYSFGLNVFKNL